MAVGDWWAVPLADGQRGAVQVIAEDGDVVGLRVGAARWGCDPGPLDVAGLPSVADHLPVPAARLAGLAFIGKATPADALDGGYALWVDGGRQPVIDAPLPVILGALLAD